MTNLIEEILESWEEKFTYKDDFGQQRLIQIFPTNLDRFSPIIPEVEQSVIELKQFLKESLEKSYTEGVKDTSEYCEGKMGKDSLRSLMPEIEKLKESWIHSMIGETVCNQVIKLIQSRSEGVEWLAGIPDVLKGQTPKASSDMLEAIIEQTCKGCGAFYEHDIDCLVVGKRLSERPEGVNDAKEFIEEKLRQFRDLEYDILSESDNDSNGDRSAKRTAFLESALKEAMGKEVGNHVSAKASSDMPEKNYVSVGQTVECGNCHPEKYADCKTIEFLKCDCKCHERLSEEPKCKKCEGLGFYPSAAWGIGTVKDCECKAVTDEQSWEKEFYWTYGGLEPQLLNNLKDFIRKAISKVEEECQEALQQMNEAYNKQRKIDKGSDEGFLIGKLEGLRVVEDGRASTHSYNLGIEDAKQLIKKQ